MNHLNNESCFVCFFRRTQPERSSRYAVQCTRAASKSKAKQYNKKLKLITETLMRCWVAYQLPFCLFVSLIFVLCMYEEFAGGGGPSYISNNCIFVVLFFMVRN